MRILIAGLEPKATSFVEGLCKDSDVTKILNAEDFAAHSEHLSDQSFAGIFCGPALRGVSANQLAQSLATRAPKTFKCYIATSKQNYEPSLLLKSGYTAAFVLPTDAPLVAQTVNEKVIAVAQATRALRMIRLFDLEAGEQLAFETFIFLPLNNKYVLYTGANAGIPTEKVEKLRNRQVGQLHIDLRDMSKFFQYSAKKLRELGSGEMPSAERAEKLKVSVRGLLNDLFDQSATVDLEQGKEVIRQVSGIISSYVTKGASANWYGKLMASIENAGDSYSHSASVSVFAALFAMGIGHKSPENLAMAGLFHDLGLAALPDGLQEKKPEEMSPEEAAIFYSHPERSMEAIKSKRIVVPDAVEKAILQHHEAFHGRGFPKQYPGGRIYEDAQILSFADQFEYLMRVHAGAVRLSPIEALEKIQATGSINPDLIGKFKDLLIAQAEVAKSA